MLPTSLKETYRLAENIFLFLFFFFCLAFFAFHLVFARKVIPGITIAGVGKVSGLSQTQALAKISAALTGSAGKETTFDFGATKKTLRPTDLGVSFDIPGTAQVAYNTARSGNILTDLQDEVRALIYEKKLTPAYNLNEAVWEEKMAALFKELSGRDAQFVWDGQLFLQPGHSGARVEYGELKKLVLIGLLSQERTVNLNLSTFSPQITEAQLQPLVPKVKELIARRPALSFNREALGLAPEDLLKLLDFKEGSVSANPAAVSEFVEAVAAKINKPAKSLSFESDGKKITKLTPGEDGLEVQKKDLEKTLAGAVLAGNSAKITVPVKRTSASVAANSLGIKELLGRGESNFAGSIPGRIKNIKIASSRVSGTLVAPGEVFSFGQAVGEISAATGYDYAYIISQGRTILGAGGGVCQVSTTVFRAALNAGLPIVTRTAHAYRVHYYEEGGSPVGLDATVYPPTVDLKFKNDTPGYILITAEVDLPSYGLYFNIYGTSDGRSVKLIGPDISNYSAAPAAKYQEDPNLPKGVTKQIDWSAPGSTVIFDREVYRDGKIINSDKFISNYRPWQAIYLVGTKE